MLSKVQKIWMGQGAEMRLKFLDWLTDKVNNANFRLQNVGVKHKLKQQEKAEQQMEEQNGRSKDK